MMTSTLSKVLLTLSLAGGLAACDITPVQTMWALRNIDPMTTAPAGIRFAVRIPQGFRPGKNGITLNVKIAASDSELAETERFIIQRNDGDSLPSWMRRASAPLYEYKIADNDLERFRSFQHKAALAKASKREGELSIGTEVCRLDQDLPPEILVSAFIKTIELEDYVPLFEDQDITKQAPPGKIEASVPLCH